MRLRQVPGVSTQAYSETHIAHLLEECYEQCRGLRWWDHLTAWYTRTLDGTTGKFTVALEGAREGMRDVQCVYAGVNGIPLTMLDGRTNPSRYSGTTPRAMEALTGADDPTGTFLFRVWPIAAVGDVSIRARLDTADVFDDNQVIVPFDSTALINGACMKYAMGDGTNPGAVAEFDRAYNERVMQLQQQHDARPLSLDTRPGIQTDWLEEPFR